ncbi:MAG: TAXI family TRAP transporter solute-binding subunit [Alphaproteobacteria bacterium]|nr:TAXI family TRAP transporter solute-binding subunit [Alphaproteobacteria bacterium]
MMGLKTIGAAMTVAAIMLAGPAEAQTRVTLKAATAGSSYYLMTVQLAEALRTATNGQISATVEESQGSVQNVREAPRRPGAFTFTSPPSLVRDAMANRAPFQEGTGFDQIRALWTMPPVTMHWVVRADSGIQSFEDLVGKSFVAGGRGTFTERSTRELFRRLGIEGRVTAPEVELGAAIAAMRNRQIDGFASGSSHPAANLQELAVGTPIRLLALNDPLLAGLQEADPTVARVVIPANTYQGVTTDTATIAIPVGMYGTTRMDDATAYELTRIFWTRRAEMARANPWWNAVAPEQITSLQIRLHPGAARYYAEAGIAIPDSLK